MKVCSDCKKKMTTGLSLTLKGLYEVYLCDNCRHCIPYKKLGSAKIIGDTLKINIKEEDNERTEQQSN